MVVRDGYAAGMEVCVTGVVVGLVVVVIEPYFVTCRVKVATRVVVL